MKRKTQNPSDCRDILRSQPPWRPPGAISKPSQHLETHQAGGARKATRRTRTSRPTRTTHSHHSRKWQTRPDDGNVPTIPRPRDPTSRVDRPAGRPPASMQVYAMQRPSSDAPCPEHDWPAGPASIAGDNPYSVSVPRRNGWLLPAACRYAAGRIAGRRRQVALRCRVLLVAAGCESLTVALRRPAVLHTVRGGAETQRVRGFRAAQPRRPFLSERRLGPIVPRFWIQD